MHVIIVYYTIGSQFRMDGVVRCGCICNLWTDCGDSWYAAWELVVVEVSAVIGGVVGVYVV